MATNNSVTSPKITLASAVAQNGTVVVPYPTGYAQADFIGANLGATADAVLLLNDNDRFAGSAQVTYTYGSSNITVTNTSAITWPAGATIRCGFPRPNQAVIRGGQGAAITALTDSTGGTPSTTLAAITAGASYAQADLVAIKNAIASLAATQATMISEMKTAGVTL